MNSDREILLDLIQACNLIQEFCDNLELATFTKDIKTQSSVLYQIVIIGKAINRLSPDFVYSNPQIPISGNIFNISFIFINFFAH